MGVFHMFSPYFLNFYDFLDDSKIEAEIKSDINSEIQNILPNAEAIEKMINDVLDLQLGQTDMKVRHILTKSVEVICNLNLFSLLLLYYLNQFIPDLFLFYWIYDNNWFYR